VAENLLYVGSFIGALWLGAFAVALGSYARFHTVGQGGIIPETDLDLAVAFGIGMAINFVFAQAFRLNSKGT
jgi:hypothetical protein